MSTDQNVLRVLELGAGVASVADSYFPGADITRVDIDPKADAHIVADVRDIPEDIGTFQVVVASHVLEHLPRLDVVPALLHWASFVEVGGRLQIHVPDLGWAAKQIARDQGRITAGMLLHIYGDQGNEWGFHRCGFSALLLRSIIRDAGLWLERLDSYPYQIRLSDQVFDAKQLIVLARRLEATP